MCEGWQRPRSGVDELGGAVDLGGHGRVDLRGGPGAVQVFRQRPKPGWNGVVDCEVLEVSEPPLLRYS